MAKKKIIKLKKGMKVRLISHNFLMYGTLIENVKKGFPALVSVESNNNKILLRESQIISIRPTRLRKCTRKDMLEIAIDKMKRSEQ